MSYIVIYGTPTCSWCKKAIEFAKDNKYKYEYIDITSNEDAMAAYRYRFESLKISVPRTVPQVFVEYNPFEDEYIGGFEDFVAWHAKQDPVSAGDLYGII